MIVYPKPIPVHADSGIIHAVASWASRKYKDTVLVFQTGPTRYIHVVATTKERIGSTCTIRKPSYNSFKNRIFAQVLYAT